MTLVAIPLLRLLTPTTRPMSTDVLTWYEAWFHGVECLRGRRVSENEWRGPCFQCGGADDLHLRGTDIRLRTDRFEVRKQSVQFWCSNGCMTEEATRTVFRSLSDNPSDASKDRIRIT